MNLVRLIAFLVICFCAGCIAGCGESHAKSPRPVFVAQALTTGNSMLPAFSTGERVALELCRFEDLRSGDTVIYWHDETKQYVHHRIFQWSATNGRWVTKGDNNPEYDRGFMSSDEFVGRTRKL